MRARATIGAVGLWLATGSTAGALGPAAPPPPPLTPPSGGAPSEVPQAAPPRNAPTTQASNAPTPPANGAAPATRPGTTTPPAPPSRPGSTPPPPPGQGQGAAQSGSQGVPEVSTIPDQPTDLSGTWGYSRRNDTLKPRYVRPAEPERARANPRGFYSGVTVQGNQSPPHPVTDPPGKAAALTWTGFERTPDGSRVFFQLTDVPTYEVKQQGAVLTIVFQKTKVNVRNNLRHLDLRYFKTPVQLVRLRRKGNTTVATVTLKQLSEPTVELVDKGTHKLLVLSFTHASEAVAPPTAPPMPRKGPAATGG